MGFLGQMERKSTTMKMILSLVTYQRKYRDYGQKMNDKTRIKLLQQMGSLIGTSYYSHLTGMENMKIVSSKECEEEY